MQLLGKRILIISPEPWGVNFLSKHHYADTLASLNNEVFFSHPKNPSESGCGVKLIRDRELRGMTKLPRLVTRKIMRHEIKRILSITGELDIIWSYDNSRLFHLDLFKAKKSIAHIVDFTMDFQSKTHATTADLCIGVTRNIASRLASYNQNSHLLRHGLRDWHTSVEEVHLEGKVSGLYMGNLLRSILDREVILGTIERCPEVDFHFLGSLDVDNLNQWVDDAARSFIKKLKSYKNVHLLGSRPANQVASYIKAASFCWIAYDLVRAPEQFDSHKTLEYLSQGKPVFSTPMESWTGNDLVLTFQSAAELSSMLKRIEDYQTDIDVDKRVKHAFANTYAHRVKQIEKLLDSA